MTERSIGEIVGDIKGNVERLFRAELRLVKAEVAETAQAAAAGTAVITGGVLCGVLMIGFLLLAVAAGLAQRMPVWQAALIVAVGIGVVGALLIGIGIRSLQRVKEAPGITIQHAEGREEDSGEWKRLPHN